MIRPLAALTRQAQDMFHQHLVGFARWEDVEFLPRERNIVIPPDLWARTKRGRRIRPERPEGKFHHILKLRFGAYDLTVAGPAERPPAGLVELFDGADDNAVEGPLAPETWLKIAEHIKKNFEERKNVA